VWAALTSPAHTRPYFAELTITSTGRPDASLAAHHGTTLIPTGAVVAADKPSLLVYRLDEPQSGDIDCWLAWHLDQTEPGPTRITLTADTLPTDPPVDVIRLLSNLKTYLETAQPPGSYPQAQACLAAAPPRATGTKAHQPVGDRHD
jgi:uncharacterized protein YndB with AHSA1/START domain